jgi:endothelin-converting enzyme/putative endopeptidase
MRLSSLAIGVTLASFLLGQTEKRETPLTSLPYSPSLDLTSMDRSVDPCVDFYKYSCGGWIKKNPIPGDQARWDVYGKLAQDNQRFLWGILQQAAQNNRSRGKLETQIGDYFAACMDEAGIEKLGVAPIKPGLAEIDGIKSLKEVPALLAREHLTGSGAMFDFSSGQDYADSSRVIAFASAAGLGLPDRDYYVKTDAKSEETRKKYIDHVQKMFVLIGEPAQLAAAHAQVVMNIETELAKKSFTRVEKRDPHKLFHKVKLSELQAITPSFAWNSYLSATDAGKIDVINITEPDFFKELQNLLQTRGLEDWKTYLRWHYVHSTAYSLSSPFVMANFDFYSKYLRGLEALPPRWKRCVRGVDSDLGEALGQVFVQKTFAVDTKTRAVTITKEVEAAMEREIKDLPWMSEPTRKRALEKLHSMVNKIGYPDRWRDYSSIQILRDDYFGNGQRSNIFESKREIAKIGKPLDRTEWQMTPPTVNAYYDAQMNDMNFPAGVLQPPLFDPKIDDAPNYGNTGATIGHELTHGFDDEGRQFDAKGNLMDWWTKQDAKEFQDRAKCISDEYAGFTIVDDIKINSKLTLGEDVADLGGTLLAYLAWKNATRNQNLRSVDGLTPDQRFFVGMAQWACGDERPESKRLSALTNPHSPNEYRINGVVSNMPEFQRAFSCKAGAPMVRTKQCKVW